MQNESQLASTDLQTLRNEIAKLLHPNDEQHFGSQSRVKRAALLAFAALGSVGLFGSGFCYAVVKAGDLEEFSAHVKTKRRKMQTT